MRLNKNSLRLVMLAIALPALTSRSAGQTINWRLEGTGTWWWEGSIDGAQTWQRGVLSVPESTSSVIVRAWCSFPAGARYYFGSAVLDAYVSGAGPNDTMDSGFVGYLGHGLLQPRRFGDIIKLDDVDDTEPPGLGAEWLFANQPPPSVGPYTFANPITRLVEYRLHLDGSPGDRVASAVFNTISSIGDLPDRPVIVQDMDNWFSPIVPLITHEPLTIRVIPSPGSALAITVAILIPRRRRSGAR